jgi:RNA polymerase sigma-70 factor (ECF subfamily)
MTPNEAWGGERYWPILRLLARGLIRKYPLLRGQIDESDIVQQTLLRACQAETGIQGRPAEEQLRWLQAVLVNHFRDALDDALAANREVRLEQARDELAAESSRRVETFVAATQSSAGDQASQSELRVEVAAALFQLPEDQREIVIGHDLEGQSLRVLAEQCGLNKNQVAIRLAEGRRQLRCLLAQHA